MKKLIFSLAMLFAFAQCINAQTPPLNKQETLDYINRVFISSHNRPSHPEWKLEHVKLDGKVILLVYKDGSIQRQDFFNLKNLVVRKYEPSAPDPEPGNGLFYIVEDGKDVKNNIFNFIQLESDANRLKKALEHLIELVKAEKSTDPFDN